MFPQFYFITIISVMQNKIICLFKVNENNYLSGHFMLYKTAAGYLN
ncbi:hypothetical protein Cst_c16070 [Thermoclostridium stercorarium subsp. stercorarium DSM 8532]|uniref:Uncharacterized protein n=1 Tax=Thermoclostridium stercorarium (strain ATCC 35414 / DSM 8532 / NCIMB 11754) TaxID=1121335 RepID=L7VSR7_THES1|nr:hypothetical protein Cst_c16070 [Thermoclostridium stercorarium subsp. stercorarium DSM 8532]